MVLHAKMQSELGSRALSDEQLRHKITQVMKYERDVASARDSASGRNRQKSQIEKQNGFLLYTMDAECDDEGAEGKNSPMPLLEFCFISCGKVCTTHFVDEVEGRVQLEESHETPK